MNRSPEGFIRDHELAQKSTQHPLERLAEISRIEIIISLQYSRRVRLTPSSSKPVHELSSRHRASLHGLRLGTRGNREVVLVWELIQLC